MKKRTAPASTPTTQAPAPEPAKRPAVSFEHGFLKLSVWENDGKYGPMFAGVLVKRYKDDKDDWHDTPSVDSRDFLDAAALFHEAWLVVAKQNERFERYPQEEEPEKS